MAIPPEFNEVEHLQSTIRRYLNRQIREDFQDLGGDSWEPEVGTTRGAMRHALTHKDSDPLPVTLSRMFLYYFTYGKAQALQTPVYGMPVTSYQEVRKFQPQIFLHFLEDSSDIEEGYAAVTGEISFRIMNQTSESLSKSELTSYANRIKTAFATNNGFIWKKGKSMVSYIDRSKGYQLQLLCRNETEGRRVIEQVLDVQQHTPDWKYMNVSENVEATAAYPTIPKTITILGKVRKEPRRRPIADVRFTYAAIHLQGVPNAIVLVDRIKKYRNALVAV